MRTIVYVHGLGERGRCFDGLVGHPALAHLRHERFDLPGYGDAPWPDAPLSLIELADGIAARLAGREPAPILVGHSMGGVIGVHLVERHPDAVAAFVNIEGNVSPGDCTFSGRAAAQTLEAFAAGGFDALRDAVRVDGAQDPALRGYHAALRHADPRSFHRHALELVAASRDGSMAARLAALRVPVRYVAGVPGGAAPRSLELLAAAAIPTTRVEPAGHWPFIDQPDAVARVIAELAA